MNISKPPRQLFAVGDVHGQYEAFVRILRHAKLVDAQLNWCGGRNRLLQIGDILDRGPHPKEVDALLDKLQPQAAAEQGEVIRLVGNHEAELLLGNFMITAEPRTEARLMAEKLRIQVFSGALRAAYAYKGYLFTHAGVTSKLFRIFKMQLDEPNESNMAILINMIFRESVKHSFFKHPIFNISLNRRGTDKFGGIFWEDIHDLMKGYTRSPLRQVVGHTPVEAIVTTDPHNIIAIDVGLHENCQYLCISPDGEAHAVNVT